MRPHDVERSTGTRPDAEIASARFEGERFKASLLGTVRGRLGDHRTRRQDLQIDVRLTLETDDGAVVLVHYQGRATRQPG